MLKLRTGNLSILAVEVLLFGIILLTIWLDEFLDLPKLLLGAPPTPYRFEEYLLETTLIGAVGIIVVIITYVVLKRVERLEGFLRVCAWCRSVWLDGQWVTLEQYMESRHDLKASHGICPACHDKLLQEGSPQKK